MSLVRASIGGEGAGNTIIPPFLRRQWKLMAAVAGSILAVVVLFLLLAPRVYTASSAVIIDPRKQTVVEGDAVLSGLDPNANVVETEMQIMRSRALAEKVLDGLKLADNPRFNPPREEKGGLVERVFYGRSEPAPEAGARDRALNRLLAGLKVSRVGDSYAIRLAFTSSDPTLAAQIANKFADIYVADQVETKNAATAQANQLLSTRLEELRRQLVEAEAAAARYRREHGLLRSQPESLAEQQELSSLNAQFAQAQAEAEQRRALAESVRRGSEAADSPVLQALRRQQAENNERLTQLEARYGSGHPQLAAAREEAGNLQRMIDEEEARIAARLEAEARAAQLRAESQAASLRSAEARLVNEAAATNSSAALTLAELERNAQSLRTLYETYLDRFKQTSAEVGMQTADARVIAHAIPPEVPSFPNVKVALAMGVLLSLFAALAAAVLAELLRLRRLPLPAAEDGPEPLIDVRHAAPAWRPGRIGPPREHG